MAVTSLETGAVFLVVDKATAVIAKIGKAVANLDKEVISVQKNLAKLGDLKFANINAAVDRLTQQFAALGMKADASIGGISSAADAATASTRKLAAEWRNVQAAANSASTAAARSATSADSAARARRFRPAIGGNGVGPWGTYDSNATGPRIYARAPYISNGYGAGPWATYDRNPTGPRIAASKLPWETPSVEEVRSGGIYSRSPSSRFSRLFGSGHTYFGTTASGMPRAGISGGGIGTLAVGGAFGLGLYNAITIQDLAEQAAISSVKSDADLKLTGVRNKQFTDLVTKMSPITTFSQEDVGLATLDAMRLLGPKYSWDEKMKMMPGFLKEAALDARLKRISLDEAAKAFTFLPHMTGQFEPEAIKKSVAGFTALSTMSDKTPEQMSRFMSYALPVLSSPNFNFKQLDTEAQISMMMAAGLNSKSGTWLRELGTRLSTPTGKAKDWMKELKFFGLVDDKNQYTFYNDSGNPDLMKAIELINKNSAGKDKTQVRLNLKKLLGVRGLEAESILSTPGRMEQFEETMKFLKEWTSKFDLILEKYNTESIKQNVRGSWQEVNKDLTELATKVLPAFSTQIENLTAIFRALDKIGGAVNLGKLTGGALIGAVAGFMVGGPGGAAIGASVGGMLATADLKSSPVASTALLGGSALTGAIAGFILGGPPGAQVGAAIGLGLGTIASKYRSRDDYTKANPDKNPSVSPESHPNWSWWERMFGGGPKGKIDDNTNKTKDNTDETKKNTDEIQKLNGLLNPSSYTGGAVLQPAVYEGPGGFVTRDGVTVPTANAATNPMGAFGTYAGGPGSGPDPRGLVPYIRQTAIANGINPDVAVRVARSEGLEGFVGDHGTSFGAFQLHVGGLADQFRRDTGLNPADPKNEKATIDWTMKWLAKNRTWSPWMGARAHGITGSMGIGIGSVPSGRATGAAPFHDSGTFTFNGQTYHWGSGGARNASIPYGDFPITPGTVGPWGASHGALGINNNNINGRLGIELHRDYSGGRLLTEGCIAIPPAEFEKLKPQILSSISSGHPLFIHHDQHGLSIDGSPGHGSPGTDTASPAIAPHQGGHPVIIHTNLQMDARTVGKSIMKVIAREGNAPARGGRLQDNFITRPLSI